MVSTTDHREPAARPSGVLVEADFERTAWCEQIGEAPRHADDQHAQTRRRISEVLDQGLVGAIPRRLRPPPGYPRRKGRATELTVQEIEPAGFVPVR